MEKSKVYFTTMKTTLSENLPQKLKRLILAAGMDQIDFDRKYTAIKMHFGEPGNLAFLRPNYAAVVVNTVKELGGKPFLTDCNTLYVGGRKNALDHLDSAYQNGFSPFSTGCHVLIADGLKGTDETLVPIDGEYVKEAKIGRAVMDADVFISLNHFKGHEATGFGGALKNIGMGCGSRAGRWRCTAPGSPMWSRRTVSAAATVSGSVPTGRRRSQTARQPSIRTNVWAADGVSESVPRTPYVRPMMSPMIS